MPAQSSHKGPHKDPPHALRADARENRERILAAAREAYAVHGVDAPVTAIARRAGVGVATLYRRFPTRDALVEEAFAEQLTQCVAVLDKALEDPDPWHGFCSVIEKVCEKQAHDRGFTTAFLSQFPGNDGYARDRSRAEQALARLVRRAQDSGELRADFALSDIPLLLLANNGVIAEQRSQQAAAATSRRLVAYLLQSFRTPGHPGPDGPRATGGPERLPRPAPLETGQEPTRCSTSGRTSRRRPA